MMGFYTSRFVVPGSANGVELKAVSLIKEDGKSTGIYVVSNGRVVISINKHTNEFCRPCGSHESSGTV